MGELIFKPYTFIFKGHEYVSTESARNQGECPHCGHRAKDKFFFTVKDEGYIGYKETDEENCVVCFQCPVCLGHFFYHHGTDHIKRSLE